MDVLAVAGHKKQTVSDHAWSARMKLELIHYVFRNYLGKCFWGDQPNLNYLRQVISRIQAMDQAALEAYVMSPCKKSGK